MVIVYRYEHPSDGCGPYTWRWTTDSRFCDMMDAHADDDHPPIWWNDAARELGLPRDSKVFFKYGCTSRAALSKWFEGYEELLSEAGFIVAEYSVPNYNVTKPDPFGQVAFLDG